MVHHKNHPNIENIKRAALEIGPLRSEVVFVGGATTTIYLNSDEHHGEIRETIDVDIIMTATRPQFYRAEEILRDLGFKHVIETNYRFEKDGLLVDLMPIDESILGFPIDGTKRVF